MEIERFIFNMFQENCYVVSDETKEAVIIDCGAFYQEEKNAIISYIEEKDLKVKHLLCTHAHIDHVFGNKAIYDRFKIKPELSPKDKPLLDNLQMQAKMLIGIDYLELQPEVERYLLEYEVIHFGNHKLQVIPTPGHSPGGVFFHLKEESLAFSGDTLFQMSIGRTDFELGDYDELIQSLSMITKRLPKDTLILTGHGPSTTISEELKYNPYLRDL